MSTPNASLARRWFEEVWNQRRPETIDALLTSDSICYSDAGEFRGPQSFKTQVHARFLAAFPDLHIDVEAVVEEGNDVVVRWLATGTHTGDGLGMPATGRAVRFRGITWIRMAEGKLLEGFDCWNFGGLMSSLQP